MISISRVLLTILALCALATDAIASAKVDPLLRPYLNGQNDSMIKVIAVMKDQMEVPRLPHVRGAHGAMEVALRRNAQVSQKETFDRMMGFRTQGASVRVQPLWIVNAMIIDMPGSLLSRLVDDQNVVAVYANRPIQLVRPMVHEQFSQRAEPFTYGLNKLQIPQVREKFPQLIGTGIRVGILDTGVDATHPDLKDKVILFKSFFDNGTTPSDDHGHGTHVAGTIAGGNSSGTSIGIAPGAKIIFGKIFKNGGGATWELILKAMQWAADPDGNPSTNDFPNLVSNSWGGGGVNPSEDPKDNALCQAVGNWSKLGIVPVFAAGNSGSSPKTIILPGGCPDALTVGATDSEDKIASFSSRGPAIWKTGSFIKPTISAPGVKVLSAKPGGGYQEMSGTSMATPHTSGLTTLVMQAMPNLSVEGVIKAISGGSKDLGSAGQDNDYGWGRIDAYQTLNKLFIMSRGGR